MNRTQAWAREVHLPLFCVQGPASRMSPEVDSAAQQLNPWTMYDPAALGLRVLLSLGWVCVVRSDLCRVKFRGLPRLTESGVASAVRARPRGLCHIKLGLGISKYDLLGHASHTRWLHRSVCISRTMCTNPQENAETAAARMQWRLGSGRPGLPARISAVHAYVHGSDCSD